jgi:hypothetical protein
MADPAIVEFVTVANMAGVNELKAGMAGLSASTIGLGILVGALVVTGKAAVENYNSQETANRDLANAIKDSSNAMYGSIGAVDDWITKNAQYIDDQYAAKEGIAAFIRAGMTEETALRLSGNALDIAAVKHVSLADAQHALLLASEGNTRGLRDLGFTAADLKIIMAGAGATVADVTKLTTDAKTADDKLAAAKQALQLEEDGLAGKRKLSKKDLDELKIKEDAVKTATDNDKTAHDNLKASTDNLQDSNSRGLAISDAVNGKVKDGKKALDDQAQSSDALKIKWQNFTSKDGPDIIKSWDNIQGAMGGVLDAMDRLSTWLDGYDAWVKTHNLGTLVNALNNNPGGRGGIQGGRASGGSVGAGGAYTVGEQGPETLVMGDQGGSIIPNGGGGVRDIHIHMDGIYAGDGPSLDRLANLIAQRLSYATGL